MSIASDLRSTLDAIPSDLPAVERRPVMPGGFAAGATTCGIKPSGRPDLMVIRTTGEPAAAAAVFTTNVFPAAPVLLSRTNLAASLLSDATGAAPLAEGDPRAGTPDDPQSGRYGWAEAVVSTSGSANAATGMDGLGDQVAIAQAAAAALRVDPLRVLCLSTGVIGTRLPLDRVRSGLAALAAGGIDGRDERLADAAIALRTTDTTTKVATASVVMPGEDGPSSVVRVTGIAKGVGMIHPRMATMLSVVLTDAAAEPIALSHVLRDVTARTWNQLSVDGDTSTNDTVFLLASSASGSPVVRDGTPAAEALRRAVEAVARDLARQQAADGEGASTLITCQVSGASDDTDARAVARAVVSSALVKTAVRGRDPNWGRIVGAAGNARLPAVELLEMGGMSHAEACRRAGLPPRIAAETLQVGIAGTVVFDGPRGGPIGFDRSATARSMDAPEILIRLDLGLGSGCGEAFGCDLTEQYVIENAEYTT